jgi:hypothetical protein
MSLLSRLGIPGVFSHLLVISRSPFPPQVNVRRTRITCYWSAPLVAKPVNSYLLIIVVPSTRRLLQFGVQEI